MYFIYTVDQPIEQYNGLAECLHVELKCMLRNVLVYYPHMDYRVHMNIIQAK